MPGGGGEEVARGGFDGLVERAAPDPEELRGVVEQLAEDCDVLVALGRYEEAIAAADEVIIRLEVPVDPVLRDLCTRAEIGLAEALRAKGLAEIAQGRYEDGIPLLDTMIDRYQDGTAPELRRRVALALGNKLMALVQAGCLPEAFAVRDYLIRHFGEEGIRVIKLTGVRL